MSSTASDRSGVDDLGPDALLAALKDAEARRRQAELDQLQLAYQWCVLHPRHRRHRRRRLGRRR